MRGVYRANVSISALAAARTLLYLTAPANRVVEILSITISTKGTNVTNQLLEAALHKVSALGTPTATTLTPTRAEAGDQAAGSTVRGNVTASEPTYTSAPAEQAGLQGWSSLAGYQLQPLPEDRPYISGGDTWGLRLLTATFTATDLDVEVSFREIG